MNSFNHGCYYFHCAKNQILISGLNTLEYGSAYAVYTAMF